MMGIMQYNNSSLGRIMYSTTCASKAILSKLCYNKSMQLFQTALKLSALTIILHNFLYFFFSFLFFFSWEQLDPWRCRYRYRYKYLNYFFFIFSEFSCSLWSDVCQPHLELWQNTSDATFFLCWEYKWILILPFFRDKRTVNFKLVIN